MQSKSTFEQMKLKKPHSLSILHISYLPNHKSRLLMQMNAQSIYSKSTVIKWIKIENFSKPTHLGKQSDLENTLSTPMEHTLLHHI